MTQVSLGNLSPELNDGYSKMFSQFLGEELGLKNDRGYMYAFLIFEFFGRINDL